MAKEIVEACRNGELERVKDLVEQQHVDPNEWIEDAERYGKTPLHWAAHFGRLEVMKYLVEECKCDPMLRDMWENTPLHWAARFATLEAVKYLVEDCNCEVMCRNIRNNTPLHDAALGGQLEVVTLLASKKNCDPGVLGRWGRTPLHYACEGGSFAVVKFLLDNSRDVNPSCQDNARLTPLHIAASQGSLSIVQYLIEKQNCEKECKDHDGETPLHEAIKGGRLDVMKYLISKGCDPMRGGQSGGTALHHACQHGRIEEVKYLIAKDNLAIDKPCDNSGASPLHVAAVNGRLDVVKLLVETFLCKLDVQDSNGQTPLELAQDKHEYEIVSYLRDMDENSSSLRSTLLKQLRPKTKQAIPTGTVLGSGAYSSVIELRCEGKIIAGKIFRTTSAAHTITVQNRIKDELNIMMEVSHPNIVQTMGVCFLPEEPLPLLLMERMESNLHSYLMNPNHFSLPIQTKLSILCDIANGLACLHNHRPPIIHRDLTANNVLLDSDLRAKIADFGNSQISQTLMILGTLTSSPQSLEYYPQEDCSHSLDVFQFGDLALFTTIQEPVRPLLPPTYTDKTTGMLYARSEVERRQPFVEKAEYLLSSNHSLVKLINQCLHNDPEERPRTGKLLTALHEMVSPALEIQSHHKAYQQALKEGVPIPLKYLKVLFFGPPRTGKTSMRRRLVGEILNLAKEPIQASTGIADAYDVIVKLVEDKTTTSTTVITTSKWSNIKCLLGEEKSTHETDLDEELRILYQFINGFILTKKSCHDPDPVDEKEVQGETTKGQSPARVVTDTLPSASASLAKSPEVVNPNTLILQEVASDDEPRNGLSAKEMEEIEKAFEAYRKVLQTPGQDELKYLLDGTMLMNMVDTGGQPAFLEMLPALTMGPALFLIFFRLNQKLKQRYQIQYLSEDNEDVQLSVSSYTVEEVIFQVVSSIACFGCTAPKYPNMPNPSNAAMLVGTHRDLLGSDAANEIKSKDDELQQNLREIFETDICEPERNFLHYASDDQLMFAIDNMTGDEEELKKVRKRLEEVIEQEFDNFPIPASWLMFNIFLHRMGNRIMSLSQCHEIGDRLKVTNLHEALWFLHHCVGTLMHFPDIEEIKDIVICDPQIIFDSVTNLILNSFKLKHVNKSACDRFKEAGQFSIKDIKKIAKTLKSDTLSLPKLVKLLEYLNIIALIPGQSDPHQEEKLVYFMPAVLKDATEEELHMEQNPTDPVPLILHFKCGFVPVGVFCAKIASLVAQKATVGWILQEPHKQRSKKGGQILCKNKATFRINGTYDVTLISKPKWYEIYIACISTTDRAALVDICSHVLKTVCDTLDQVISMLKYKRNSLSSDFDQTVYELGFKCPEHPNDDHLVINRPKGGVDAPAKVVWLRYHEGMSVMICLEEEKSIDFTETSLSPSFAQQSLVWFGKAAKIPPLSPDSRFDDPNLPKITLSHLQLIKYGHVSNVQTLRLLQCLAPKWRKVGEILGLHRAVIHTIENPGSGSDPEDCIRKVFMKWLDNAPQLPYYHQYPLTWRGLHNLLLNSEHGAEAVELKAALLSQFNTVQGTYEAACKIKIQKQDMQQNATQPQEKPNPHSVIAGEDATPETPPIMEIYKLKKFSAVPGILGKRRHELVEESSIDTKRMKADDSGAQGSDKGEVSPHPSPIVLSTDDLYDIYSELLPVADEWRNIGLALRLNPDTLNTIGTKENAKDCLLDVLHQWLKKTYNVKRFGEPSWKLLVKAVNDPAGGNDRALAEKIAQKHQDSGAKVSDKREVSPHPSPVVLGTDNLYDIYCELFPVASKWKNIGLALRLTPDSLNTIGAKENVTDCLLEVLIQWLKKTYNVKLFGEPSWKLLVKAVSDPAGGNDCALAEKIAQRHQVPMDEI